MDSAAAPVVVRKPRRLMVEIIFVLLPYGRSEPADHLVHDSQSRFADQAATATHEGGLGFSESFLGDALGELCSGLGNVSVTAGLTPDDALEADLTEPYSPEGRLAEARLRTNVTF